MPPQSSKHYQVPFGNGAIFVNHPGVADIKIQPKSPKFVLDMRYFCNFSLVSLGVRPRSRRCAERTRYGEGRWSRPPKAALERSYIRPRIPVPRIACFGRNKRKLLTKSLTPKNDFIYMYVVVESTFHISPHWWQVNCSGSSEAAAIEVACRPTPRIRYTVGHLVLCNSELSEARNMQFYN